MDGRTGVITTVAGNGLKGFSGDNGQGTSARLGAPRGLALDGDGTLYIADSGNNRIRKLDLVTGIISTWRAQLWASAVTVDQHRRHASETRVVSRSIHRVD